MTAMFAALGREPKIEYIDMPEAIRDSYQYFTQAEIGNLRRAGYNAGIHRARRGGAALRDLLSRSRRPLSLTWITGRGRATSECLISKKPSALIAEQTVLCVGDLMLDDFVYGEVTRISPEAPTPVLAVRHSEVEIGGAGNVARNIAALGAHCIFVGLIGDDEAGPDADRCAGQARRRGRPRSGDRQDAADHAQGALRVRASLDPSACGPIGRPRRRRARQAKSAVIAYAEAALPQVGAVVLSDYAKGVLTARVIRAVIETARRLGKPVVVDPKGHDYRVYRGATLITPNRKELAAAVHRPVHDRGGGRRRAAAELARMVGSEAVLVKRSEEGMTPACRRPGAGPRCRPIRSRCATSPAPATRWPR